MSQVSGLSVGGGDLASLQLTLEDHGSLKLCLTPPSYNCGWKPGYQGAEQESCSQGYAFNAALLQSRFSQGKMGQSNFLDFCKHGRKETCYTEAAEVLR